MNIPIMKSKGNWLIKPLSNVKQLVSTVARHYIPSRYGSAQDRSLALLAQEIEKLSVLNAGIEQDSTPYIQLVNGPIFYGYLPTNSDRRMVNHWNRLPSKRIPTSHVRLASDIVCRYVYPHADVDAAPPYPLDQRGAFHPQHRDTVRDIPIFSEPEKATLRQRFAIRHGDVVLDIGAFLGFGALKISEMVGPNGQVICFEADPDNQTMFRQNMGVNKIHNVELIAAGCWKERGTMKLNRQNLQRNSLIDNVVTNEKEAVEVATETVDDIVEERDLSRVTLVSLTINGAEIEALQGMDRTLHTLGPNLTIAGWYERDGIKIHQTAKAMLSGYGYQTVVGNYGRVYAWKP